MTANVDTISKVDADCTASRPRRVPRPDVTLPTSVAPCVTSKGASATRYASNSGRSASNDTPKMRHTWPLESCHALARDAVFGAAANTGNRIRVRIITKHAATR